MKKKIVTFSLLASTILFVQCNKTTDYAAQATCTGTAPTYNTAASAIIDANCATAGCHSNATKAEGITLEGYANASAEFKNDSKTLTSVHHGSGVKAMPLGSSKLSDASINILDCWVKNGCPQ
jgi:hypothetical protein